jgi:preprotein translocase subunit SecB
MDEKKQPGINFDNVLLTKLEFQREPVIPPKSELVMRFDASVSVAPENNKMTCELSCQIEDKSKSFKIICSMVGMFSTVGGSENMSLEQFAQVSAPALVFPFLRETIASITAKAGMPPLLLPPMNIKAMLKPADDNKNKEKALP